MRLGHVYPRFLVAAFAAGLMLPAQALAAAPAIAPLAPAAEAAAPAAAAPQAR